MVTDLTPPYGDEGTAVTVMATPCEQIPIRSLDDDE